MFSVTINDFSLLLFFDINRSNLYVALLITYLVIINTSISKCEFFISVKFVCEREIIDHIE